MQSGLEIMDLNWLDCLDDVDFQKAAYETLLLNTGLLTRLENQNVKDAIVQVLRPALQVTVDEHKVGVLECSSSSHNRSR